MSLTRSAWKRKSESDTFFDYILILPQEGVIVTFASMQTVDDKRVIWGCWIREEADGIVYTAVKNAKLWRRESYLIQDEQLTWDNGCGCVVATWNKIEETEIPQELRDRGIRFLEKFISNLHPAFITEEQAGIE